MDRPPWTDDGAGCFEDRKTRDAVRRWQQLNPERGEAGGDSAGDSGDDAVMGGPAATGLLDDCSQLTFEDFSQDPYLVLDSV